MSKPLGAVCLILGLGCWGDETGAIDGAIGHGDAGADSPSEPDGPAAADGATSADAVAPSVCDDFERSSLGSSWMPWASSNCAIVNDSDLGQPNPSVWCYAVYGTTFGADQFSESEIAADKPGQILTQVFARQQPFGVPEGNGARYGFHYNADPGKAWWEIKYDGVSTPNTRVWTNDVAPAPVPGDTIRIEVRGSDPVLLKGFHNGVEVLSVTDAEPQRISATGKSGVVERPAATSEPPPTNSPVFERWCGGDL